MDDQYEHWAAAIRDGKPIETGNRDDGSYVRAGYFRNLIKGQPEAIAFWRDDGVLKCKRTGPFGDGRDMAFDEIEELFANVCRYPIGYDIWIAVRRGEPWPRGYETRLTMKEIQSGVAWTEQLRQAKLEQLQ